MLKSLLKLISPCVIAVGLMGCSVSEKPEVQTFFGYALGTSYSVKVVASQAEARSLQADVDAELSNINRHMSTYLPRSDLSVFSESESNKAVKVDPKTAQVVNRALEIANETSGYFDPTVAELVDRWGFGPTPRNVDIPSSDEVARLMLNVGYQAISVDLVNSTLSKQSDRSLDLSAIAKGYAVDQVARILEDKGFDRYLVEVGGEMRLSGTKPDNALWRIAIERPVEGVREPFRLLEINNLGVATSGDYRNFYEKDGTRYSHTIDPTTGYPVTHDLASATVLMPSCMDADAYATAFMAMGREKALEFANLNDIAAFFIYKADNVFLTLQSEQFTKMFGVD